MFFQLSVCCSACSFFCDFWVGFGFRLAVFGRCVWGRAFAQAALEQFRQIKYLRAGRSGCSVARILWLHDGFQFAFLDLALNQRHDFFLERVGELMRVPLA